MKINKGLKFMAVSAAVTVGASAGFASAAFAADFRSHGFAKHTFSSQGSGGFSTQGFGGSGSQGFGGSGSVNEASKPAAQIFSDAKKATLGAKTVQIAGSVNENGTNFTVSIVAGQRQGSGTITMGPNTFHVVLRGKNVYLNAPGSTWDSLTKDSAVGSLLGNQWIQVGKYGVGSSYVQLVTIPLWVNDVSVTGSLTNEGTTTYKGQAAIDLRADDGSDLYVAAQGPAYVLGVVHSNGDGAINFSNYNTARVAPAPHGAKNLNSLGGGDL